MTRAGIDVALCCSLLALGCGDDRLTHATMGILNVTVINAGTASAVDLTLRCDTADSRDAHQPVTLPQTLIQETDLTPGSCEVRVVSRDASDKALGSVWMSDLLITGGHTTAITVDMSTGVIPPPTVLCGPDGATDPSQLLICSQCANGIEIAADDDARCPSITCGTFFSYVLRGSDDNGWTCVKDSLGDVTTDRCDSMGKCLAQSEQTCQDHGSKMEAVVASVDASDHCHLIDGCTGGTEPSVDNEPDGTACDEQKWCQAGECVCKPACGTSVCGDDGCGGSCGSCTPEQTCTAGACVCTPACGTSLCGDDGCGGSCGSCTPEQTCTAGVCVPNAPEQGCADGTREGFQSLSDYPTIAACSGGWSVPGVTRDDLVPTCNRAAGNNGSNAEGTGCSAADLCASGWHVCKGKTEVAANAGSKGCQDSVPANSPAKSMFFAVYQHSTANTLCDDTSTGDNDVFGCGNLGTALTADKACGPLSYAFASANYSSADSCGFKEAEPSLGPWQCLAASAGDLHEGANVTKNGCPNQSCNWNGATTGNWDRGGVLCCKD